MTRAASDPTVTLSPSPTVTSTSGIFAASFSRRRNARAVPPFQFRNAAGVLAVMVGDQNVK